MLTFYDVFIYTLECSEWDSAVHHARTHSCVKGRKELKRKKGGEKDFLSKAENRTL